MSYTFSRRDFMKYSAVAAVAVAGSSMFTGCGSFSNPNRPSATYDPVNGSELSFGGKSGGILGFGGTADSQTLLANATYDYGSNTLTLPFKHVAVSQGASCKGYSYQIDIVDKDDKYKAYIRVADENILANEVLMQAWKKQKTKEGTLLKISKPVEILFSWLDEHPYISIKQFCRIAHINYYAARNILSDLMAMGAMEYVVIDKCIAYKLSLIHI